MKPGDRVFIVVRRKKVAWGIVKAVEPQDIYVAIEGDESRIHPYSPSNVRKTRAGMKPGDTGDVGIHHQAWETMPLDSVESFRDHAKGWLGDKTELSH